MTSAPRPTIGGSAPAPGGRPRRGPGRLVLLAFVFFLMPLLEVAALIGTGRIIGTWQTILLLVVMSALGAWLMKREGSRAWLALREALQSGRLPARELTDAALVLVGGALLLTPGFITDAGGLFLILPATRPISRRWLQVVAERQLLQRAGIVRGEHIPPRG